MIAIITSSTGVDHALAEGQRLSEVPKDEQGRRVMDTVCGKHVKGATGMVTEPGMIRCRPCKGGIARGRRYTPARIR